MITKTDKLTPAVKRLLIEFMALATLQRARQTAQPGQFGLVSEIAARIAGGALAEDAREALASVNAALTAMRGAADPNPWRDKTDEEIAQHLMDKIAERRQVQATA